MVSASDAKEIIQLARDAGIEVFLDGGWGIDALLGRETRSHNDIDLFIEKSRCGDFVATIMAQGFREVITDFSTEGHSVWEDESGRIIDLHRFERSPDGSILYEGELFPSDTFSGSGTVEGIAVPCTNAESQVAFHLGYEHDEDDAHDVMLLCETFRIAVPNEYRGNDR